MSVKFTSNQNVVLEGLEKMRERALDSSPLMKNIANDMKSKVQFRFRNGVNQHGEKWEPLKESTISRRRSNSDKPLSDTGRLKSSINSSYTATTAVAGTNVEYAAYQNYPVKKGELGTVNVKENVRSFTRKRKGRTEQVKAHTREREVSVPWGDKPGREFIGFSNNQIAQYKKMVNEYLKGGKE